MSRDWVTLRVRIARYPEPRSKLSSRDLPCLASPPVSPVSRDPPACPATRQILTGPRATVTRKRAPVPGRQGGRGSHRARRSSCGPGHPDTSPPPAPCPRRQPGVGPPRTVDTAGPRQAGEGGREGSTRRARAARVAHDPFRTRSVPYVPYTLRAVRAVHAPLSQRPYTYCRGPLLGAPPPPSPSPSGWCPK